VTAPSTAPPSAQSAAARRAGLAYAIGAYAWWGLAPAYFKALGHVPSSLVLAHRILWSALLLAVLVSLGRQWPLVQAVTRQRSLWPWLAASTVLVSVNWLVFIYAIATERLVEASLGYFINPLVTVVLAMAFLGERLRPAQQAAAIIAAGGVAYLWWAVGGLPWIALVLPVSFGLYGLIRKKAPVGALAGLFVETALLAPLAIVYALWAHLDAPSGEVNSPGTLALLSLAGIVTAIPMLWFVAGARRLPLTTMGFLQYLSPTVQLLTAVAVFAEPFPPERMVAFAMIWVALGLFAVDTARHAGRS
jgi:chloramphenicol-sensitive protein RarD